MTLWSIPSEHGFRILRDFEFLSTALLVMDVVDKVEEPSPLVYTIYQLVELSAPITEHPQFD